MRRFLVFEKATGRGKEAAARLSLNDHLREQLHDAAEKSRLSFCFDT